MKYYKALLVLLVFFSISYNTYAKDAEKLEVEFQQTKKLKIKGITKFTIVDPAIAKVELSDDILTITSTKYGSTPLFIWKSGEIIPYVIYSVVPKKIISYNTNQVSYNVDYTKSYGSYRLFTNFYQTGINSNQNLIHQLSYKSPFYDGFLTFNGSFNNAFRDIKNLQSLDINNLQLIFNNKSFSLSVGDISAQLSSSLSQFRGTRLKGGSFQYNNSYSSLSAFAGIESLPLNLYSRNSLFSNNTNNVSGGLYGRITPFNNLSLFTNYTLRLNNDKTSEPNIVSSVRWNPLNSLYFNSDLATDFKGKFAYNINSSFFYNWAQTKESLKINALVNHFDKDYSYNRITDRSTYLASASFKHRSGTNLSGSVGRFDQSGLSGNSFSLLASKVFETYYNISGSVTYNNNATNDSNTRYTLSTQVTNFLPINLNYSYVNGIRGVSFNESSLFGSINLFETSTLKNILSTSIRYSNNNYQNNEVSSLLGNFNLGLYYSGIKRVNLSAAINYGRYSPNLKQIFINNSYGLNLSGSWDASIYNKISLAIGVTKDDLNSFNVYSSLGYNYSFGEAIDAAYTVGSIKGVIFDDTNSNGIFDENEKIIPDIKLKIGDKTTFTDSQGYSITGIDYGNYDVNIDNESLPNDYKTTSNIIETVNLSSKVKEYNIPIRYESVIKGYIHVGLEGERGLSEVKIIIDNKDSITTDSEGYFYTTVKPGKHTLKLDYTSIPQGYTFNQSLTREIETTKEDTEINFIFEPVRIITIQAYETNSLNQGYSQNMKAIENLEVTITYPDGKTEVLVTDENGNIILENLQTGTIEINSKSLKEPIQVEVPENIFEKNIEIPVLVK